MATENETEDSGSPDGGGDAPERPEFLPEKFWDSDASKANFEGLAASYVELEKKLGSSRDDVRKEISDEREVERAKNRPATPEDYKIDLPDGVLPEGVTFAADDNNPMLQFWRGFAHEQGLTAEIFNQGVGAYAKSLVADVPDSSVELKKLGDKGPERVDAVYKFLKANLSGPNFDAIDSLVETASGVEALEQLVKLARGPNIGRNNDAVAESQNELDLGQLREMVRDPKYWQLKDPVFVKSVDEGFKRLFPGTSDSAHRGPLGPS